MICLTNSVTNKVLDLNTYRGKVTFDIKICAKLYENWAFAFKLSLINSQKVQMMRIFAQKWPCGDQMTTKISHLIRIYTRHVSDLQ